MLAHKIRKALKPVAGWLGEHDFLNLPVSRCVAKTDVIEPDKSKKHDKIINILALSPFRFTGDLKALASTGKFRILMMPEYWQYACLSVYADGKNEEGKQRFLQKFLKKYAKAMGIDLVAGTALWYSQDMPWGEAAEAIGIPFVVLHKECLKTEEPQLKATVDRCFVLGKFKGSSILLHNDIIKKTLVDAGYVEADKVLCPGAMRMDAFVERIKKHTPKEKERKLVSYFSFTTGMGLDDWNASPWPQNRFIGWTKLFELSHVAFAKAAIKRPDVDFVIKTKWGGIMFDIINEAFEANNINPKDIPNLEITYQRNAQDLIIDSDVLCSFSSTTQLEAGLLNKPVVIPHFEEAVKGEHAKRVKMTDTYHLFDIANNPKEFTDIICDRLDNPATISDDIIKQRWELFEKWIAPTDGKCLQRYVDMLTDIAEKK